MIYSKFGISGFEKAKPAFEEYIDKHAFYERNHHRIDEQIKKKVYSEWEIIFKAFGYEK